MRIFRRLRQLEEHVIRLAQRIAELFSDINGLEAENESLKKANAMMADKLMTIEMRLEELENKLPSYEQAVSEGVDKLWSDALQRVADYNPYSGLNIGGMNDE